MSNTEYGLFIMPENRRSKNYIAVFLNEETNKIEVALKAENKSMLPQITLTGLEGCAQMLEEMSKDFSDCSELGKLGDHVLKAVIVYLHIMRESKERELLSVQYSPKPQEPEDITLPPGTHPGLVLLKGGKEEK